MESVTAELSSISRGDTNPRNAIISAVFYSQKEKGPRDAWAFL